jgi:hypothetical protein
VPVLVELEAKAHCEWLAGLDGRGFGDEVGNDVVRFDRRRVGGDGGNESDGQKRKGVRKPHAGVLTSGTRKSRLVFLQEAARCGRRATGLAEAFVFIRTFMRFIVPIALTKKEQTILATLLSLFLLGLLGMVILEEKPGEVDAVSREIVSEPLPPRGED